MGLIGLGVHVWRLEKKNPPSRVRNLSIFRGDAGERGLGGCEKPNGHQISSEHRLNVKAM